MGKYVKPVVLDNKDLAEGIYAASGNIDSGCYSVTARIHQTPEPGRDDYRIQVNAIHDTNHTCKGQLLTLEFNQAVQYVSSNGQLRENNGNVISIMYSYWNNPHDNIGLGDVVVKSSDGLAIINSYISDTNWRD